MPSRLYKYFGWKPLIYQGDPALWSRYKWVKKHIQPGPLRTLDAGFGNGCLSMYAASLGNRVLGIGIDQHDIDKANARVKEIGFHLIRFKYVDLRELANHNGDLGKFDQIILSECIEHVLDDKGLIHNLAAILNPGGRLIVSAPFLFHKPYYQEYKMQVDVEDGGHVRFGYTGKQLKELLRAANFEVIAEEFSVGWITKSLASTCLFLNHFHPRLGWATTFPLRFFQLIDDPVTKLINYPFTSIGVVAEKTHHIRGQASPLPPL